MPAEVQKTLGWLTLEALVSTQMLIAPRRLHSKGTVCHASGLITSILGRVTNRFTVMGIHENKREQGLSETGVPRGPGSETVGPWILNCHIHEALPFLSRIRPP